MKETIFISHANPENIYFAALLSGKLRLFGYKVWVDVKDSLKYSFYFILNYNNI